MSALSRSKVVVVGATLVFAVIAAMSLSLGSSGASATGLTLTHATISIGGITVDLDDLYNLDPQLVLTGDHFFSEHFDVGGGLPITSLLFMVDLLTPATHITILLVIVVMPTGAEIILHGPFLLNANGALLYHVNLAVNPLDPGQVLYANASAEERHLVLLALHGGNVLAHFVLAH